MATVRSTRWRQHTCTPLQLGRRRGEEEGVAFCSRQKKRKKAAQVRCLFRASAVSGEDHKPSGQCFMAADGQIYWQPTPQRSAAPRGYKPGPRFIGYEQQYPPYEECSPSAEPQRASKSRQQIRQAGPVDTGPACDSRYIERAGAPSVATPRTRASRPVLREAEESGVGPEPKLPAATPSRSERGKEAPDSRQGAAKIVDPADGAQQQHTAAAEPRERKPSVLLFLACSMAFVAVAVAVILVYTFGTPATARRLKSPRFCGDVPSWRTNRLKNDFMKCSEESCSKIACGPINDTWCLTGAPPFDSKCECCDWCIVRDLDCLP
ncbi:uncharacterized protein LOC142578139 isoform X3 [Dermacentor variabilis]|uniref:uncharacterized protein LOC142578139 isoform X3 n=1 Tax=Dermacentor variabilis TaxID=34621 RepID=UPI003F5C0050